MSDQPLSIFIASASEGLDVAKAVRDALKDNPRFTARVWNEGTFKPSMTFVEALEAELKQSDFAVITLTPDDHSDSRGQTKMAPRDNVLFELGLFMGHLGRDRTYFICDRKQELKIPTDLLGVKPATYELREGQELGESIRTACESIADRIKELGVRTKRTLEVENEHRLVSRFCERIAGTWWGRQSSAKEVKLSLFRITPEYETSTVQLDGDTFDREGKLFGRWKSLATGIRIKEKMLFFSWEGSHPILLPGDIFHGFGQYTFQDASGIYDRGTGLFADLHLGRKKAPLWKSVDLCRVDIADLDRIEHVMRNGTENAKATEVMKALDEIAGSSG